jgi:two-component system nitrate/nitrite response regulator NarL
MAPREIVDVSIIGFSSLVREGIGRILSDSEFRNLNFYACVDEAIARVPGAGMDIAIVDFNCSDEPIQDILALKSQNTSARIVLMVDSFDFKQMTEAFRKGAHAYLLKEIAAYALIDSLRLVIRDEKVLPSALLQHLPDSEMMSDVRAKVQVQLSDLLSDREIDTLRCLVMGYPNKVIAFSLEISEATVKVHVKAILRKLSVQNRTQAAIWAVNQGLITHSGGFREYRDAVSAELAGDPLMSGLTRTAPLALTETLSAA